MRKGLEEIGLRIEAIAFGKRRLLLMIEGKGGHGTSQQNMREAPRPCVKQTSQGNEAWGDGSVLEGPLRQWR